MGLENSNTIKMRKTTDGKRNERVIDLIGSRHATSATKLNTLPIH